MENWLRLRAFKDLGLIPNTHMVALNSVCWDPAPSSHFWAAGMHIAHLKYLNRLLKNFVWRCLCIQLKLATYAVVWE